MPQFDVTVVGSGNWGTTLALLLCRGGRNVALLTRSESEAEQLSFDQENKRYLPGFSLPNTLVITADREQACNTKVLLLAVPSKTMRANVGQLQAFIPAACVVLSCAKGLEPDSFLRMSVVIEQALDQNPERIGTLSGPNIAREIAHGLPAATVIALPNEEHARQAQHILTTAPFRVYRSSDVIGVEIAGALKNIIALGAGIADGMHVGDNAKAAFLTRGLTEIARLGTALGAQVLTFAGLAGLGDLLATCASPHSRNRRLGEALAQGESLEAAQAKLGQVAEGVGTTRSTCALASEYNIEMPITNEMYNVLFEGKSVQVASIDLMQRDPKDELAGFQLFRRNQTGDQH